MAIEVLGGNGAIETFSVLPRLLRDNVVYPENWEGSHNVLRAQVLRDCARLGVHEGFFYALAQRLGEEHADAVVAHRAALDALLEAPAAVRDLQFRRLGDAHGHLDDAGRYGGPCPSSLPACRRTERHLRELPIDDAYLAAVQALQR